jgi:hypothetical protein
MEMNAFLVNGVLDREKEPTVQRLETACAVGDMPGLWNDSAGNGDERSVFVPRLCL